MNEAKIAALFGNPSTEHSDSKPPNCWVKYTQPDGSFELKREHRKRSEFGHFQSKTGSMRRSRKGRTYHAPNGYARYNGLSLSSDIPWSDENRVLVEVVAYQA